MCLDYKAMSKKTKHPKKTIKTEDKLTLDCIYNQFTSHKGMHSLLFPSAFSQGETTYIKKACSCHPDIQTGCIQACSNLLTYYKRLTASRQTCSILPLGIPKGNIEHHFSTHLSKKTRAVSEGNHYWGNKLGKILLFPQRPKSRLKSTHLPK